MTAPLVAGSSLGMRWYVAARAGLPRPYTHVRTCTCKCGDHRCVSYRCSMPCRKKRTQPSDRMGAPATTATGHGMTPTEHSTAAPQNATWACYRHAIGQQCSTALPVWLCAMPHGPVSSASCAARSSPSLRSPSSAFFLTFHRELAYKPNCPLDSSLRNNS